MSTLQPQQSTGASLLITIRFLCNKRKSTCKETASLAVCVGRGTPDFANISNHIFCHTKEKRELFYGIYGTHTHTDLFVIVHFSIQHYFCGCT